MIAATRRTINRLRVWLIDSAIRASEQDQERARCMTIDGIKLSMIEQDHQNKLRARRNALIGE